MPGYTESADDFEGGAGRLAGSRWAPDGPSRGVVLLLHGGGQTRHSWGEAGPALAADGWTAVAIDFRGHGDSDRAADGRYRVDAMAVQPSVASLGPASPHECRVWPPPCNSSTTPRDGPSGVKRSPASRPAPPSKSTALWL
jgi:pimeloyl-ACP methyl ester carboxylesterase